MERIIKSSEVIDFDHPKNMESVIYGVTISLSLKL